MIDRQLLVFVRLPEKGAVKTRLAGAIGADAALSLYKCFVSDTLALAGRSGYPTRVCFHPANAQEAVVKWLGAKVSCTPQKGEDLGERMYDALRRALCEARCAVLIGSDCPGLPAELLDEAFLSLQDHDAVLGPAGDGGYYLIGFASGAIWPEPFHGIDWGAPTVFRSTRKILGGQGLKVHLLPSWNDIDDYESLQSFYTSQKDLPPGSLRTVDFLRVYFNRTE